MRGLLALALLSGLAYGQTVGSLASSACPLGGCAGGSSGTVTTTGTLAAGQVALGSGATSITGDAGLTYSGTGDTFALGLGASGDVWLRRDPSGLILRTTSSGNGGAGINAGEFTTSTNGLRFFSSFVELGSGGSLAWSSTGAYSGTKDLALSRASAGTLLVEDGSGNARDVQARAVYAPTLDAGGTDYLTFIGRSGGVTRTAYFDLGHFYPAGNGIQDIGVAAAAWRTGYFGTSVVTPVVQLTLATPTTSGDTCTAGTFWADASYLYVCTATNTIKRAALSAF